MVMNGQETAKVYNSKTGNLHVRVDFLIGKCSLECTEIGEYLVYIAIRKKNSSALESIGKGPIQTVISSMEYNTIK